MLEVTSDGNEARLGIDFAEYYKSSSLFMHNKEMVEELSKPLPGKDDLYFEYSQSIINQFRYCPEYNLARLLFSFATSLLFGTIFWQVGKRMESSNDVGIIIRSLYTTVLFIGVINCITVQPLISVERKLFYRERAAGMYSALPYAFSLELTDFYWRLISGDHTLLCANSVHDGFPMDGHEVIMVPFHLFLHLPVLHLLWNDERCQTSKSSWGLFCSLLFTFQPLLGVPHSQTKNTKMVDLVLHQYFG